MANKLPWFPFFVNDFLSDQKVELMTTTEVGAYTLLLLRAWKEEPCGSIPADDAVLAVWTRLGPIAWTECKSHVLACFQLRSDGRYYQKRMCQEYAKLTTTLRKRADAGRKGGISKARKGRNRGDEPSNAMAMPEQCSSKGLANPCDSESKRERIPREDEIRQSRIRDGGPGEGEENANFDLTAEGIAQALAFYSTCPSKGSRDVFTITPMIRGLIGRGIPAQEIMDRVMDKSRPREQHLWEFTLPWAEDREQAKKHGSHRGKSKSIRDAEYAAHQKKLRDEEAEVKAEWEKHERDRQTPQT